MISILKSVFFLITYIILFTGFLFYKKSNEKLNGISWVTVTFLTIMCFNTFVASVINLISIPVNTFSLSLFYLIMGLIFWIRIIKTKERQEYSFEIFDFIATAVFVTAVVILALFQFGTRLHINYETSDPSQHLRMAMDVYNTGRVNGMFFAPLNNALFIEMLSPFTSSFNYYKIFILSDIGMLLLSSMMFYSVIRKFISTPFMKVVGIISSLVYLLGYPLNNMIFGFVYLGISISITALIVFFCDCFVQNGFNRWISIIVLSLGCLSVFLCYMEFMPVVYIGVFMCICLHFFKKKQLFKLNTLYTLLAVFGLPIILGLFYGFFGIFNSDTQLTVGAVFTLEGYIYRDLYSNFIIFLPFAIFGLIKLLKANESVAVSFSFLALVIFIIGLFILGVGGVVSGYYFYKCYYLLWFLVFYISVYSIYCLASHAKCLIICYTLVWAIIATINFTNAEVKFSSDYPAFSPIPKSGTFFDIFNFNKTKLMEETRYNPDMMSAFRYIYDNLLTTENQVQFAGYWENVFWYESITNQRINDEYWWKIDQEVFLKNTKDGIYGKYLFVEKYPDTEPIINSLNGYERVFENNFGIVFNIESG